MGELRRVEDSVQQQEFLGCGLPGPTVEFEQLIGHLCAQLCEFMRARQKTMDLYPSSIYFYFFTGALTLCMVGSLFMLWLSSAVFFFSEITFQEHYQSVRRFGSISELT